MLRRLALPAVAAALAVTATAPLVATLADARPAILPGDTPMERLRYENRQLRLELQQALAVREDLARGLERLEQLNRGNRDLRSARRIGAFIRELQYRNDLDQPWGYQPEDPYATPPYRPDRPTPMPPYPSHPSYPPTTGPGVPTMPPIVVPPQAPPGYPRGPGRGDGVVVIQPVAMDASSFASLHASVRDAGYSDQQLAIVTSAAERAYFSVDQVVALIGLARFEEVRIEIAVAAGARVIDPDRWTLIDGAFSFAGSAAKVRQRLGR
jgi:hypothetical protein